MLCTPASLAGLTFETSLRVEADLGWREGAGRMMTFTLVEDGRQIAALLAGEMSDVQLRRGERYRSTLIVRQGGLIEILDARRE